MDHTGNGGRFRYFTRLRLGEDVLNVNQELARLEQYGTTEEVQKYLSDLKYYCQVHLNLTLKKLQSLLLLYSLL